MKKEKYIAIKILSVIVLLLGATACTDETETISGNNGDGIFRFSAAESIYASTAEISENTFDANTLYQLYAISDNNWNENCLNNEDNLSSNAVIGTEQANHTIQYSGNNKFRNRTLSFYGVTASNTETLPIKAISGIPAISVEYPITGGLPDILWASKPGQTYNQSGTIQLAFIHTLSKLNLKVLKNSDVIENLAITKIELCDYASGDLDISTGEFKNSEETRTNNYYTVFEGSQVLTITSAPLTQNNKNVEPTIFPTRKSEISDMSKHSLGIKVSMNNNKSYTYWTKEIALDADNQPIMIKNEIQYKPFQFKPNYEYDVQLTLTESAMVVTILPRMYDWIPKEEEQGNSSDLTEIGNPVTFGGVTWMDRNLGATSADPSGSEMDWERSRGFYYQFGRSIPYYLKGSMQDPDYEKGTVMHYPTSNDDKKASNAKPFPYIYGHYNDNYQKWSSSYDSNYISVDKLAKSPQDQTLDFRFAYNSNDLGSTYRDWDENHSISAKRWEETKNDPCPKGWRLPTSEEFLKIFPIDIHAGDITFNPDDAYEDAGKHKIVHEILGNLYGVSNTKIYKDEKSDGVYIGIKETSQSWGTIYAIKNKGKSNAYRIRWSVEEVGSNYCNTGSYNQKRTVLVISRYPATTSDNLTVTKYNSSYTSNYNSYDWDHPSEVLKLPIAGYIHADANGPTIIYAGCETIYWTSDKGTNNYTASSVRIKIKGDQWYKALNRYTLERRGYGCLVRCVRDNSVKN